MGALAPLSAQSQQPKSTPAPAQQQQQQAQEPAQQGPGQQAPAAPEAYKPVAVQLPKPLADPSFETFRKQLVALAQKKDRAGLGRVVAQNFFWVPEDQDAADKSKSGIENLSKAIGLEGGDASGWELLATFANEPTADPSAERSGVVCAPGEPNFDENAAEDDLSVNKAGVTLVVDPLSLQYLMGAEIDYTESLHGAQFVIRNPNATTTCGCGSSFSM